jgi:hypothetical protein
VDDEEHQELRKQTIEHFMQSKKELLGSDMGVTIETSKKNNPRLYVEPDHLSYKRFGISDATAVTSSYQNSQSNVLAEYLESQKPALKQTKKNEIDPRKTSGKNMQLYIQEARDIGVFADSGRQYYYDNVGQDDSFQETQ